MSAVAKVLDDLLQFRCPGCGHESHVVRITGPGAWGFNGSLERPTLTPSVRVRWTFADEPEQCCHFFVRDGQIEYLPDCTHALAGQTVPLPAYEAIA